MFKRTIRALLPVIVAGLPLAGTSAQAQTTIALPQINVVAPSPIRRAAPSADGVPGTSGAPSEAPMQGTLPIVTDQFATVTVVPREEIQRSPGTTLGDVLFSKPGITGSSFAPGASSRPIIRGLDVNRVGIVDNGIGGGGVSDLGEDHFVPIDPLATNQIEVIRGPATLRYGSQSIGGVVSATNNRIPEAMPCGPKVPAQGCATAEMRGGFNSVDAGRDGGVLLDSGLGNFAFHADAFGRESGKYRVPHYPYLFPPDPTTGATQPGTFHGNQPNSQMQSDGYSAGGSYVFSGGFAGLAVTRNETLYHIPGIDGDSHDTRIDAHQTKITSKGEFRPQSSAIDAIRFWAGHTDYKHNEIGRTDPFDPGTDGVRQLFTNREEEGRVETQFAPFNMRWAELTTAVGVQGGRQALTAPSPDNAGLWDPNTNWRVAGYVFNELKFSETTKAQVAGRIERVELKGMGRFFDDAGTMTTMPASPAFTPKSASVGLIQKLPHDLVASATAQYVERAPKPAELFSGGGHDATTTFDKGNPNLSTEIARSAEVGLRRAAGPVRFEATAYYTVFSGFIFRRLTGNTCDDTNACGPGLGELKEAIYTQRAARFRGTEFQTQADVVPMWQGFWGIEGQFDSVRATFSNGTNVPRIPPHRAGGGIFYRNNEWLFRVNALYAFAQRQLASEDGVPTETPTAGYTLLKAELSRTTVLKNDIFGAKVVTVGVVGNNLLNADMRNHVSYTKDEVLMPGASVRVFASVKY